MSGRSERKASINNELSPLRRMARTGVAELQVDGIGMLEDGMVRNESAIGGN